MTSAIRASIAEERRGLEREMAVAWTSAALGRSKKLPRMGAFLGRFHKRKRAVAVLAPTEMSEERAERLSLLSRGLVLDPSADPYLRPEESD